MSTRELSTLPRLGPLYLKAAFPARGRGGAEVPDLVVPDVEVDVDRLAEYDRVCGFPLTDELPPTYPQVLAFPLHMALVTDPRFPLPALGLVHIENQIAQRRPLRLGERLSLSVHATAVEPHPRGRTVSVVTEVRVGGELVWEGVATTLRRESPRGERHGSEGELERAASARPERPAGGERSAGAEASARAEPPEAGAVWRLSADLGRRYAAVSGDRNPIHLSRLTAKPFGFPRAIAHGMWTKARCLAALHSRLPDAFAVEVRFRRPILLPTKVVFTAAEDRFTVRDARNRTPHLEGAVTQQTFAGS